MPKKGRTELEPENRELLTAGLAGLGIPATPEQVEELGQFLASVVEWNQQFNLTRIVDERDAVLKHLLDSASCLQVVNPAADLSVIDVGSGAGFPGVVLQLLRPGYRVTLLESLQKKCKFLEHVRDTLAPHLNVLWSRAEDAGLEGARREQYDVAVARAVAPMRVLAELCLPFVRVGGTFVAMKGPTGREEAAAAAVALRTLGGRLQTVREVLLPEGAGERQLLVVEKVAATPKAYPRKAGTPERKPL